MIRYHLIPIRTSRKEKKKVTMPNIRDMEKKDLSCIAGENAKLCMYSGKNFGTLFKNSK